MKKLLIVIATITLFAVTGCAIYLLSKHQTACAYRIAIITPTTHPALERIENSFKQTLSELTHNQACYTTYNAQGKKTLMHAQVAEALNGNYHAIFTIAASPTLMTRELAYKTTNTTPHIFAAVAHPERNGIIQNNAITGVIEQYKPHEQIHALLYFKPHTKQVLIVYDPTQTPELRRDAQLVAAELQSKNVALHTLEITGITDLAHQIPSRLDNIDALVILIDNTTVSSIDFLINLCNQHGITLIASDLDSGIKGAALAVGIREEQYGIIAAHQTYDIVVHKKPAQTIPYQAIDKQVIQINTTTMQQQQLATLHDISALSHENSTKEIVCVQLP